MISLIKITGLLIEMQRLLSLREGNVLEFCLELPMMMSWQKKKRKNTYRLNSRASTNNTTMRGILTSSRHLRS